ncbi:lysoplasmalogenase TMEM86A [Anticarsia gemmatalis]|uniref:lysoplasmalogenase TMEM86A n=1 Tax=Anticarsia gemmatalis TaxID=129554 RepID=UPI003F776A7F
MISPLDLMKRVGVSGRLVPFFKCVCVYFVALGAGGGSSPSAGAVAAKCAPVLSLLLAVALHLAALPYHKGGYARRVAAGLALSALGDALLVWPQHFVAGMAAFGAAHVAYLAAFGFRRRAAATAAALYLATAAFLRLLSPPGPLRALVPGYALLLATMAWRGAARGRKAAAGALLFLVSDAILGYSLFGGPVPYKQVLVMSTYYLGQLGIALSALEAGAEASA